MAQASREDKDKHIIDLPEEMEPAQGQHWCIYKVPETLRKVKPEAYTPNFISIGPIHYGEPKLKQMEPHKQRYFQLFSKRPLLGDLTIYKDYLGENEEKIRCCYSVKFPQLSRDQFVDMMLLDTVFIMELFLRQSEESDFLDDDYLVNTPLLKKGIEQDLLLLENQVPIFILEKLYGYVPKQSNYRRFLNVARKYFEPYDPQQPSGEIIKLQEWENSKHFTDLIRYLHIPRDLIYDGPSDVLKTATKLQEAGVSFEVVYDRCLLDIEVKKKKFLDWFPCLGRFPHCSNCLKVRFLLPKLKVDDTTERVLRNLIALEQCHYPLHGYICSYVTVLDYLIKGKEDVELLVEKDVIEHQLGSDEETAQMIKGLRKQVVIYTTCYGEIIEKLNHQYDLWKISITIMVVGAFLMYAVNFLKDMGVFHVIS